MKVHVLGLVLGVALTPTAFGSFAASAQTSTTVIEEHRAPPAVVIEEPSHTTTTKSHSVEPTLGGVKSTTTTETTGAGVDCRTRTTEKTTILGSKTTHRSDCD